MKRIRVLSGLLAVVLLLPVVSSACVSADVKAALDEQFMLYVGKIAVITGENLKFQFVRVTADNRCPWGLECAVAGEAKCLMRINYSNSQTSLTFTQQGTDDNTIDFNGYKITYQLQPYPVYGDGIAAEDYRLKMTVTR